MAAAPHPHAPDLLTARLALRPFAPADVEALHRLFLDPGVRRWLLDDELVPIDWVRGEIEASDARFRAGSAGLWTVAERERPDVIGFAGFRPFHDPPELELLYGLHPAHWGRGLATEAARAVVDHAFQRLGFREVVASADTPNVASLRVMERLGMRFRARCERGGRDTAFYRLERSARVPEYEITSSEEADPADVEAVHDGLRAFNRQHAGPSGHRAVHLFLRDESGAVRGGLLGKRMWHWLYVETLWVDESLRHRGLGSRLLARAEAEATQAGCTRVLLDTFEFQALGFYERHGYSVFGVLEDFPPGYRRYYLEKSLSP